MLLPQMVRPGKEGTLMFGRRSGDLVERPSRRFKGYEQIETSPGVVPSVYLHLMGSPLLSTTQVTIMLGP